MSLENVDIQLKELTCQAHCGQIGSNENENHLLQQGNDLKVWCKHGKQDKVYIGPWDNVFHEN